LCLLVVGTWFILLVFNFSSCKSNSKIVIFQLGYYYFTHFFSHLIVVGLSLLFVILNCMQTIEYSRCKMSDFFVPHGLCIGFSWVVHSAICSIMLFLHGLPLIENSILKPLWIYDVHIVCVTVVHEMMVMPVDPLCFFLDGMHLKKLWWHTMDRKFCVDTIVNSSIQVFFVMIKGVISCCCMLCHLRCHYYEIQAQHGLDFVVNLINWVWRQGKYEKFLNIYNVHF